MPTYVYRREDGSTFELQQKMSESPLERCPETGQRVTRLITGSAGLIFKGNGFYLTDYARKNGSPGSNGHTSGSEAKGKSAEQSKPSPKVESKTADKE